MFKFQNQEILLHKGGVLVLGGAKVNHKAKAILFIFSSKIGLSSSKRGRM